MITFLQAAEVAATEEARMGLWELFTKGGKAASAALAIGCPLDGRIFETKKEIKGG